MGDLLNQIRIWSMTLVLLLIAYCMLFVLCLMS